MKVFWLVAWDTYYPSGALRNVQGTYATKEEAMSALRGLQDTVYARDHAEVIDVSEMLGLDGGTAGKG